MAASSSLLVLEAAQIPASLRGFLSPLTMASIIFIPVLPMMLLMTCMELHIHLGQRLLHVLRYDGKRYSTSMARWRR